jgi:protocatechuate 3,4-dioxygenase alpha subunit
MMDLPTGSAIPLPPAVTGEHIVIAGTIVDGAGQPLSDMMIETWQADSHGRYDAGLPFFGYRRVASDGDGRFRIETIKPGAADGAPHLVAAIYGGGVLYRYVTRIYFEDESLNATDPVLQLVPEARRSTLIAKRDGNTYRFAIRMQGERETVFFEA